MSVCTIEQQQQTQEMAIKATEEARKLLEGRGMVDPRLSHFSFAMEQPQAFWRYVDEYDCLLATERQKILNKAVIPKKDCKLKKAVEYTQDWASRAYA